MENIVKFESLIVFYRNLFSILRFNVQIKTKSMSQTKPKRWLILFKQNFWILTIMSFSISMNSIAYYQCWCSTSATQHKIKNEIVLIIILCNVIYTLLVLIQSFIYFKHLQKLWIRFEALNYSIKKRLNHEMNFRNFLKSFKTAAISTYALYLISATLKLVDKDEVASMWAKISVINTEMLIIYTKMHAIFVVELFCYFFEHFNEFVNLVYHLNSSQTVYHGRPDFIETLESYTKIYRELCSINRKINAFFGLSFLAFMSQTFQNTAIIVYSFYLQWNYQFLNILSNLSDLFFLQKIYKINHKENGKHSNFRLQVQFLIS